MVGVLALQGSFSLHCEALSQLGVEPVEVRKSSDLKHLGGIILPGGESTTFHLQLTESNLGSNLKKLIANGLPTWGTCAGAIILGGGTERPQPRWNLLAVEVHRNAYGRQVDSFVAPLKIKGFTDPFDAVFIRAPRFVPTGNKARILAELDGEPVMLYQKNILLTAFHPELTADLRVHRLFVEQFCRTRQSGNSTATNTVKRR